ncbi:MAG: diaminopimelate decarboxylase [Clostridia bacterium]|nr:diaminopimelate decarboxylase [Clostridia bacterium]
MFVSESLSVDENGVLCIGGANALDIVKEYGTPVYVMDEDLIRKNCRIYKNAMDKHYGGNGLVLYASKAFSCKRMVKIVKEEGLGLDVVSGGELYTAIKADFPMDKVYFHGNNKTEDELNLAVDSGVGTIVVDNIFELEKLNAIAEKKGKIVDIMFRIKPGIDAHTHEFVMTGQIDSKFGVALETGEAMEAYKTAKQMKNLNIVGVHCHIGSQIFDIEPFEHAASVMMGFIADLKAEGIEIERMNLGGGYGIKYVPEDNPIDYDAYIEAVSKVVKKVADEKGVEMPKILMEPGRSIVASAGTTLYNIGGVKEIPNVRTYVSVDGGMADNPRFIMYGSQYHALLANNPLAQPEEVVTIAGKCCESGDLLIKDIRMPKLKAGDTLAVLATGAYNYSMASNYNRIPKPPVVMVSGGKPSLAVKRETYEDIIKNDL